MFFKLFPIIVIMIDETKSDYKCINPCQFLCPILMAEDSPVLRLNLRTPCTAPSSMT